MTMKLKKSLVSLLITMTKESKMSKLIETIRVSFSEFTSPDFSNPCKWFILDALGDYVFIKTRKREIAQQWVDGEYGHGKYRVSGYTQSASGEITAR